MPVVLIGLGIMLYFLALLLAFTIFGELSALLGYACIAAGLVVLGVRVARPALAPSGEQAGGSPPPRRSGAVPPLKYPAHLVDLAAVDPEGGVVLAHRLGARRVEQAVHLTICVVEQFRLAHAELV